MNSNNFYFFITSFAIFSKLDKMKDPLESKYLLKSIFARIFFVLIWLILLTPLCILIPLVISENNQIDRDVLGLINSLLISFAIFLYVVTYLLINNIFSKVDFNNNDELSKYKRSEFKSLYTFNIVFLLLYLLTSILAIYAAGDLLVPLWIVASYIILFVFKSLWLDCALNYKKTNEAIGDKAGVINNIKIYGFLFEFIIVYIIIELIGAVFLNTSFTYGLMMSYSYIRIPIYVLTCPIVLIIYLITSKLMFKKILKDAEIDKKLRNKILWAPFYLA